MSKPPPCPLWMCPNCGKTIGYIGRFFAWLVGVGIHDCDFLRWPRQPKRHEPPVVRGPPPCDTSRAPETPRHAKQEIILAVIVIETGEGEANLVAAIGAILGVMGNPDPASIEFVIRPRRRRRAHSVAFGVPAFQSKHGGLLHPMTISIPNDAIANVKLVFKDGVGNALSGSPASTAGVSVSVADATVASAALADDGQSVNITPLLLSGSSSITYTDANDNVTMSDDFTIIAPAPSEGSFDDSSVTFVKNPSPPTA